MDRRAEVSQIIVGLAEYYDKHLSVSQLAMYVEDLDDLSPKELFEAVCKYRRDPKNERFPLPAKLRSMVPTMEDDPETEAVGIASRIAGAVARIGPYQPELARGYIGEVGWAVVQLEGCWENVCQSLTYENLGMLKAQWRNLAKSVLIKQANGIKQLPKSDQGKPGLNHFSNLLPEHISDEYLKKNAIKENEEDKIA